MDRLLGLSAFGGTIKIGTTFADHFHQFGRKHSLLGDTDLYNVNWLVQSTATGMDHAIRAFDS